MTQVLKSYHSNDPIISYIENHSARLHPVQKELMEETFNIVNSNDSKMLGAPEVLQMNQILMQTLNAKKVLDVGVFTGASSLAAALALPEGGKVIACDISEEFTSIGKTFWEKAGVSDKIDLHLRPATETLQELIDAGEEGTFDFAFIDADKPNYYNYYKMCLKLLRSGGIITVDNVLWSGKIVQEEIQDENTVALRKFNDAVAADEEVTVSMQNIGDGLSIIRKK